MPPDFPSRDIRGLVEHEKSYWERAKIAAQPGRKVLIATNVTGFQWATLLEAVLGIALTLRGAAVHYTFCDGVLPGCLRAEPDNVPSPELFAAYQLPDRICNGCMAVGNHLLSGLGLPIHRFSELVPFARRQAIRKQAHSVHSAELSRYKSDNVSVGEHAYAGALRYFARGDLQSVESGEIVLRRFLEASLLAAEKAAQSLRLHDFMAACFHHGIYVPQGPFGEIYRAQGVRVINWNPSYRRNTFIFSHENTYHHTLMKEPIDAWKHVPWNSRMAAEIDEYLVSRRSGTRDWIWFHEKPDEDFTRYARHVGIDLQKPIIGMLTNVVWDAQLHYPANAFSNIIDWAIKTIAYFASRPDLQLLIRIHPAEIRGTLPSRQPLLAEISKVFPQPPVNVFIIRPEEQVSTYAAMEACNAVIVYGTKMGVELTSLGIPVIVGGEAWIRNKGLTMDASSEADYYALLNRLPVRNRLAEATRQEAKRYAYHFFFRRMIPLSFIVPKKGKVYDVQLRELSELAPGRHPGLDVICDGILNGTPFIYPAERLGVHD